MMQDVNFSDKPISEVKLSLKCFKSNEPGIVLNTPPFTECA